MSVNLEYKTILSSTKTTIRSTRHIQLGLYNCPKVLKTPAQSPDLNAIEHIWDELGRQVAQRHFRNIQELKTGLQEEWQKIRPEVCSKLVSSMTRRLEEVGQKGTQQSTKH